MKENGVLYGELVVLGTDGQLPNGDRGRRRSRFQVICFKNLKGFSFEKKALFEFFYFSEKNVLVDLVT